MEKINRRDLLQKFLYLPLFAVFLPSCKTETSSTSGAACPTVGASAVPSSSTGHSHPSATVPWADIDVAVQKTYNLDAGTAGHTHTFTMTAPDMASMKTGSQVIVTTTDADGTGHSHTMTVTCTH